MPPRASKPASKPLDHRTRVGAERREKMRARLLESALLVFASQGVDATVVDEVISTAGVSRGSFYNYFRTNEELFSAVAAEVSNELLRIVDPILQPLEDPAARVAAGIRLVVGLAQRHPPLAAFVVRGGPGAVAQGGLATEYMSRDLAAGIRSGRFVTHSQRLAYDLVLGPVLAACHTVLTERVPPDYADALAQAVLQSLGVPKAAARRLATLELDTEELAADSLFERADARATSLSEA